jgi:hypothetical protein
MQRGIETLDTVNGELDRRVVGTAWRVPETVELTGGRLLWGESGHEITATVGLLETFADIADGTDDQILSFARKWGKLDLCELHGLPVTHVQTPWWLYPGQSLDDDPWFCPPGREVSDGRIFEQLDAWRSWSRRVRSTLLVAAALQQKRLPSSDDWRRAFNLDFTPTEDFRDFQKIYNYTEPANVPEAWAKLDLRLNHWVGLARARPFVERSAGKPRITLGGNGLFAAIAIQLMLAATRTQGMALCCGCGKLFSPRRRPRSDQRSYCSTCARDNVPARDALADFRDREMARRLSQRGVSVEEIARRQGRELPTVKNWLKSKKRGRRYPGDS